MAGLLDLFRGRARASEARSEPRFRSVRADGGVIIDSLTDGRLQEYLQGGTATNSGAFVTERTAFANAVAWRCASIICGVISTLPCDLMMREDESSRVPAVGNPLRDLLTVKPNNRQTPMEFTSMLQLHKLNRGDGFAMKIASRGRLIALWPLDPNRMQVIENADTTLTYRYTRLNGGQTDFSAAEIMHMRGLSWDGVRGLSVIRFMAEALGLGQQTQKAAAKLFKNGSFRPGWIAGPNSMSDTAYNRLKASLDEQAGIDAEDAQKTGILEEGFDYKAAGLDAKDAQLAEIMGLSRDDIGMFYGVPPFLYGDTQKSTSWGTGIEQQKLGFVEFTLNPHLTCWKQTYKRDCLSGSNDDPRLYVHYDLKGFLAADATTRAAYLARALGGGGNRPWMTQNEARATEELPKRPKTEPWADELPAIGNSRLTETAVDPNADPNAPPPETGTKP